MQKINKVFISLIIFCLVSLLIPFNISAEVVYNFVPVSQTQVGSSPNTYWYTTAPSDSVRAVCLDNGTSKRVVYASLVQNATVFVHFNNTGGSIQLTSVIGEYNGSSVYGYYSSSSANNGFSSYYYSVYGAETGAFNSTNTFYYTFGEGAGEDTISYGQLKIGFETSIAYSGGNKDAWRQNKDTIYFDRYDTSGNDLFGYLIELQAIPYSVEGASQQNIFAQGINNYVFDTVKIGHLGYWSPGQNSIDFTWEYVTNRFSPTWWGTTYDNWSLYGWFQNEHWYRVGWAYRARLVDEDDNVLIDWQWIYNGTSIDGPDVNNIINNNGLTPELVHSINNINNNNNTTNNNYYNNQVINYTSSDPTSDGSWIEQLISSILQTLGDLIGKILDFFSSIFDGLVDLLLGLFGDINPADSFFGWFTDLFNGIGQIDLTLPQFNLPNSDITSFNRLVQKTLDVFSFNNFGFVVFIPLLLIIIKAVF